VKTLAAFVVTVVTLLTVVAGCGGSGGTTTLSVFGESSLTDVMAELATRYAQLRPGTTIRTTFAGTQELARLLTSGQRSVDVVVTSDGQSMATLRKRHLAGRGQIVAHNAMAIAVAPGNPLHVAGLASLAGPRIRLALSAPNEAAGRYARTVMTRAGVNVRPRSMDIDVRAVVEEVRMGTADAGIVYGTDISAAGVAVSGVPIPDVQNVNASYPAAVATASHHAKAAAAFVTWLTSPEAQAIIGRFGFGRVGSDG
jgi:molybdate transport system substrate-binding protein